MKALNFNTIQQPTWPVTLKDEAQTTVTLTAPTVDLVDRLTAMAPELKEVADAKDGKAVKACYELIAEIMGCNTDGFKFTAEELRYQYKMAFMDLLIFVKCYFEFIDEIENAKN